MLPCQSQDNLTAILQRFTLDQEMMLQGALTATGAEEPVVPASEYRSLQGHIRELQRLLGKKTMEAEILKKALEVSAGSKKHLLRSLSWPKDGSQ